MRDVMTYAKKSSDERMHDNEHKIAGAMRTAGAVIYERKLKIDGTACRVVMNVACSEAVKAMGAYSTNSQVNDYLKSRLKKPNDFASI